MKCCDSSCSHLPVVINSPSFFLLRPQELQHAGCDPFATSPSRRLWSSLCYSTSITSCSTFSSLQNTRLFKPKSDNLTKRDSQVSHFKGSSWGGIPRASFQLSQVTEQSAQQKLPGKQGCYLGGVSL